jgi:hypothetical protein
MFTVPNTRVARSSRHPSEFATGEHTSPAGDWPLWTRSTKVLSGLLAAAATWAIVAFPSEGFVPSSESLADNEPDDPCWIRVPPQGFPSDWAVSVGGGQTFVPPAAVVLSLSAVSPSGARTVRPFDGLVPGTVPPAHVT